MSKNNIMTIIRYPNDILRKKAQPIEKITEEIFMLSDRMTELMLERDGIGLAANQVGKLYRVIVLNTTPFEDNPNPITVINPEIMDAEGSVIEEEGCLSFPKLYLKIPRAQKVRVQMQNLFNEKFVFEVDDFLARAVLHEIDHLNGIVYIDHADDSEKEKIDCYLRDLKVAEAVCE